MIEGHFDNAVGRLPVGDAGAVGDRLAPRGADFGGHFRGWPGVPAAAILGPTKIVDDDFAALGRGEQGDALANAPPGAGDHNHFIFQQFLHLPLPFSVQLPFRGDSKQSETPPPRHSSHTYASATSCRAMTFSARVSSEPSKIDSTLASTHKRLTMDSSA